MGYQSWGVVYGHYDACKTTLVRLEGRLSEGHDAKAKDNLCQKVKVGAAHAVPKPRTWQFLWPTPWGNWIPLNKWGSAYGWNLANGRRDASLRFGAPCVTLSLIRSLLDGIGRPKPLISPPRSRLSAEFLAANRLLSRRLRGPKPQMWPAQCGQVPKNRSKQSFRLFRGPPLLLPSTRC